MDQQQSERVGGVASPEPKPEWTAPIVDRLIAGGAEANAGNDVEGLDGQS